eukprot:g5015.t1
MLELSAKNKNSMGQTCCDGTSRSKTIDMHSLQICKSSSGKNTNLGRTQVYKENSTSSTTLTFPDLNQFWNFTDQLSL